MYNKRIVSLLAAVFIGFSGPAVSEPIIEIRDIIDGLTTAQTLSEATETVYGTARDLIFDSNVSGSNINDVARVNGLVLFGDETRVDALAKVDDIDESAGPHTTVESFDDGLTFNDGALTVTCTDDDNKCGTFDWDFEQSLVDGLNGSWDIVKIGVKYGGGNSSNAGTAYFLIDPEGTGADSGSFNIFSYVSAPDNGPLAGFFGKNGKLHGLSHVDFLGTQEATNVTEPGMLALFAFGLAGLGTLSRRRRKAVLPL